MFDSELLSIEYMRNGVYRLSQKIFLCIETVYEILWFSIHLRQAKILSTKLYIIFLFHQKNFLSCERFLFLSHVDHILILAKQMWNKKNRYALGTKKQRYEPKDWGIIWSKERNYELSHSHKFAEYINEIIGKYKKYE